MNAAFERTPFPITLMRKKRKSATGNAILKNGSLLLRSRAITSSSTGRASTTITHIQSIQHLNVAVSLTLLHTIKPDERILQRCAETRSEKLGKRVLLYKNNTDFHGHSYGCHDNYLMAREVPFENAQTRDHAVLYHTPDLRRLRKNRH